jgi:surface protein
VEQTVYPNEVSTPWGRDWREITSFHVADGCLVRPASLAYLLCDLHNMTSADLTGLDTSGATAMNDLFRFDGALTSMDLGGIDTSQATTMERMF